MSNQSEHIGDLATALATAQKDMTLPKRNREVQVKINGGGSYKFEYTTLDAVIEHIREPLTANGLWFVQNITRDNGETCLETILTHTSGQWIKGRVPVSANARMQEFGSALTYLRRYALTALLGIASEDDDDATTASGDVVEKKTDRPMQTKSGVAPEGSGVAIAPDRKAAANKWADQALHDLQTIKTGERLSTWHRENANAIAALRGFNEAKHKRLVEAIQQRSADLSTLVAG